MINLIKSFLIIYLIVLIIILPCESGLNNFLANEGTTTAELINGDIFFEIVDPAELEYTYRLRPAKDFGTPFNQSFQVRNAALVPVVPKHGCENLTNKPAIQGNVAFIERGECSFKKKTILAEKAGAKAVIITDISEDFDEYFIEMIDDETLENANIPAAFLMGKNGLMITKTLKKLHRMFAIINLPVNLTFTPIHEMNQPPWLGW